MGEQSGTTVDDLIAWLKANAGPRAHVSAADGVIAVFDPDTGEPMGTLSLAPYLTNDKVSLVFDGPKKEAAAQEAYILVIDGGLDQTIEAYLNSRGFDVEIGGGEMQAKVQRFTTK